MYYTYILKSSKSGLFYTGWTTDLRKRVKQHNSGESFATKPYRPWKLVYYAAFETEKLAKDFERYLKSGSGKAFAKKRLLKS
jgi:predicted GIY-YIG superfamily endonuclease